LGGAYLDGVDLTNADFSGALMGGVSLFAANLMEARLFGVDLRRARIWRTLSAATKAYTLADLSEVRMKKPSDNDLKRLKRAAEVLKA
jgi:uncharacterized protein YjbI with pentapeptide repeats